MALPRPALWAQFAPASCVSGQEVFDDVPAGDWACPWVEKLWQDHIVDGCAASLYCPDDPVTRRQAAVLIEKAMRQHLWGQGRVGTSVYVRPIVGLCDGVGDVEFGLSALVVRWDAAAAACPADYWVCTEAERGTGACDTSRPDGGSNCDHLDCDGSCVGDPPGAHLGWLADTLEGETLTEGLARSEADTGSSALEEVCKSLPVWCCRDR